MSQLIYNLKSISSVSPQHTPRDELVADFSAKSVYRVGSLWGMVYWACYRLIRLFDWNRDFETRRFNQALETSYNDFNAALESMQRAANSCSEVASKKLIGNFEDSYFKEYYLLNLATECIESGINQDDCLGNIQNVFQRVIGQTINKDEAQNTLQSSSAFAVWAKVDLQVGNAAWEGLSKLMTGAKLSGVEMKNVQKVIEVFQRFLPIVSRSQIAYRCSYELARSLFQRQNQTPAISIAAARFWEGLPKEHSLRQMFEHDAVFANEKTLVKTKAKLYLEGEELTLKENRVSSEPQLLVYDIEERPDLECIVHQKHRLGLIQELSLRQRFVPENFQPQVMYVDPMGKYLLQTKASHRLEEHAWEIDLEKGMLSQKSMSLLSRFKELVQELSRKDGVLPEFSSKSFLVGKDDRLIFSGTTEGGDLGQGALSFYDSLQRALGADARDAYSEIKPWGLGQFSWKIASPLTNYLPILHAEIARSLNRHKECLSFGKRKLCGDVQNALCTEELSKEASSRNLQLKIKDLKRYWKTVICTVYDVQNEQDLERELNQQIQRRVDDLGFSAALCIESYGREIVESVVKNLRYPFKLHQLEKFSALIKEILSGTGEFAGRCQEAYQACQRGNTNYFKDLWAQAGGASLSQFHAWVTSLSHSKEVMDAKPEALAIMDASSI